MVLLSTLLRFHCQHLVLLSLGTLSFAKNECRPYKWNKDTGEPISTFSSPENNKASDDDDGDDDEHPKPGDVMCIKEVGAGKDVNYYTCTAMANEYSITVEEFFALNPSVKKDCSNMEPMGWYCIEGYIEPLRAYDGLCGPKHKNATCKGTAKPCCNSLTWTCGDTKDDCADGTCYEGWCSGDQSFSTDGTCGEAHGYRMCAGIQGSCCNLDGKCGNGTAFCGKGVCQSGKCEDLQKPAKRSTGDSALPWLTGTTPDGTCGGLQGYTCGVFSGSCCNKYGKCGSLPEDCEEGCQPQFGECRPPQYA